GADILRQERSSFFGQMEQDRARLEDLERTARNTVIDDRGNLLIRSDGGEFWCELLVFAEVHWNRFVGQSRFLEHDGDLTTIGCGPRIKINHRTPPMPRRVMIHCRSSLHYLRAGLRQ